MRLFFFKKNKTCSNIPKKFDNKHPCYIWNLQKLQLQIQHTLREQKKINQDVDSVTYYSPKDDTIQSRLYLFCLFICRSNYNFQQYFLQTDPMISPNATILYKSSPQLFRGPVQNNITFHAIHSKFVH
jgi:hypothetical protein